jgi:hypothetical protein
MSKSTTPDERWENNEIQFPRLLAEVRGVLTREQMKDLCVSMDLSPSQVEELFQRADSAFLEIMEKHCPPVKTCHCGMGSRSTSESSCQPGCAECLGCGFWR